MVEDNGLASHGLEGTHGAVNTTREEVLGLLENLQAPSFLYCQQWCMQDD